MKKLNILFLLTIVLSNSLFAQKENIFHDRNFWKTNPSIETINEKIKLGNNVSALNSNAFDGVVYAILEKTDIKTIQYLLSKQGNDVNKKTHDGRTYLFWAAYKGNLDLMKFLYNKGAKTDIVDTQGNTFLNFAASSGQLDKELYEYSFKIGADLTKEKNHDGANTLLLSAPHLKDMELVNFFIKNGACINDMDNNKNGIFSYAAKGGNHDLLNVLLKKGITIDENSMVFASQGLRNKKNTLKTYRFLESIGVKVNVVDTKGRNPLHFIAHNSKDLETYSYFISKGVDINLQDNDGNSPFMNAANSNGLEVVKFLQKKIKNINLKNKSGQSALTMAVNRNSTDIVAFLIKNNADVLLKDKDNNTFSYYLLNTFNEKDASNFEKKLNLLKENGLVFNERQYGGNTLLHIATERNNLALIKRLSILNIDVNAKNKDGYSALHIASMKAKDTTIINYLLKIGADKKMKTDFEETSFALASENELLQQNKINITFLK